MERSSPWYSIMGCIITATYRGRNRDEIPQINIILDAAKIDTLRKLISGTPTMDSVYRIKIYMIANR